MTARMALTSVIVGMVGAVALFLWSEEERAGRIDRLLATLPMATSTTIAAPRATLPPTAPVLLPTPTVVPSATQPAALPTRPATAIAVVPTATRQAPVASPPTRPPATAAPSAREVELPVAELQQQFQSAVDAGAPLRDPRVTLLPPDRVGLRAAVPVAIFKVPVEMEATVAVDARGAVKVTTTRVDVIGGTLPAGVTAELGRRVDDEATRAVAGALPPNATARRVVVEPERIRMELGS